MLLQAKQKQRRDVSQAEYFGERGRPYPAAQNMGDTTFPEVSSPKPTDWTDYNRRICRIVDRLRATRIMRRLSVAEAAQQAGVAESTWSSVEDGSHLPPAQNTRRYESWLAAGPQWFTHTPGQYVPA